MIRISPINKAASAVITASTQDSVYLATNLRHPQRPSLPARTTTTGDSWWLIDYGTPTLWDTSALIGANFTSVRIQANDADAWGAPSYDSGLLTISTNINGRYHLVHRPAASQTRRYVRLFVPTQATTDGAGYFRLGGFHGGDTLTPLEDVLWEYALGVLEPRLDIAPDHGAWRTRLSMGIAVAQLSLKRRARFSSGDWAAWVAIEQAWNLADYALVCVRDDPAWGWIMRRMSQPKWTLNTVIGDADLELEEVLR